MAKVRMAPELQRPPTQAPEPTGERDVAAEQAAKAKELKHQQEIRAGQQAKDNAAILRDREATKEAELKVRQQQREARENTLNTPLSAAEEAELQRLENLAMRPGNREPETMLHLGELRRRAKLRSQPPTD